MKLKLLYGLLTFLFTCFIAETGLRLCGYQPHSIPANSPVSEPAHFVVPDSVFFIRLKAGFYRISLNRQFAFTATHTAQRRRITATATDVSKPLKSWYFTGCSYTYGFGVNDTDTYLYQASQAMPHIQIENFAVPGYGTLETFLLLKKLIADKQKLPDVLVYNYLHFHNERNRLSSFHRLQIMDGYKATLASSPIDADFFSQIRIPGAYIQNNTLKVKYMTIPEIESVEFSGRRISALAELMAQVTDKLSLRNNEQVTIRILHEINKLCRQHHIRFMVSYMQPGLNQDAVYQWIQREKIACIDISFNSNDTANYNYPFDSHPSAKAHTLMAHKLVHYMQSQQKDLSPLE